MPRHARPAAEVPARRVLVMELAGLGDNVHLLPALWLVRRNWPQARLEVMVSAHVAGLFRLTPWVDAVWEYPRVPRSPGFRDNLRWASRLRRAHFDVVINTTGSDRSSLLTRASCAPVRAGRRPADGGPWGWSALFTDVMTHPYYTEPMFRQKFACLRQLGFAGTEPEFHVSIDAELRRQAGIAAQDEYRYIHLSPFTTADARELPAAQVAELVRRLRAAFPQFRLIVSCAATEREQRKLERLLALLDEPPWLTFAGTLDLPAFAALLQTCALNLSGDTGSLHVAMLAGAPALAWFRQHRGQKEWIPEGPRYRVLIAEGGADDALHGIDTDALLAAAAALLTATGATSR
jgi:ADP-heptose:LPS heptosyltransferase